MLLAIDAGNTNILFALHDTQGKSLGAWRASTDARRTADENPAPTSALPTPF